MDMINERRTYTIEDLEELLDNIPYEVWIKDKEGRHKYINKISAERMGFNKEDIIGKTDYDFRPSEMAESCTEGDRGVLSTGKSSLVEDRIYVGDEEKWFEIYKTVLYAEDNCKENLIGGIARYTNIHKSKSDEIIESYLEITNNLEFKDRDTKWEILDRFKTIIAADDVALYLYDKSNEKMGLETHLGDHDVIFVQKYILSNESSNTYFDMNNYMLKEELTGNSTKYIYPIINKNKLLGSLQIYFENNPINIHEEIIKYTCTILAFICENKSLENNLKDELKKSRYIEKKLGMVINTAIDIYAIAQKDGESLKWIETSKKCDEIIGWSCEELNSRFYLEFIHPEDKDKIIQLMNKHCKEVYDINFRILCKNNQYKLISFNWNTIDDKKFIVTGKDITNLEKLQNDKKSLQQAVEIESLKTQFFANISHEFKTPLNIILSAVQLMINCSEPNTFNYDKFMTYMKSIKQNSYRLLKLANNMIDITKIDDGFYDINLDNYNIVEVVENIVQSVAAYIKNNNRTIIFDTSEEEIITACDPDKIEKIVLNLLSNSLKFTSSNGNIYIKMEVNSECSKVILKVRNDGPVIRKEESLRIFERFTQSEDLLTRSAEGTGIGLALVKSLVELHNGTIYVNTMIDKGTEFCIELPIRKIINNKINHVLDKNLNSRVEKFNIEFSDTYNLN